MTGMARIDLKPDDLEDGKLSFYLHGELSVDSVKLAGNGVEFSEEWIDYDYDYSLLANHTTINVGKRPSGRELDVFYSGYFKPSEKRSPSDYMRIDSTGVYLRALAYSLWFPIFVEMEDGFCDVSFSDVKLRTPPGFVAVFVGEHIGTFEEDGMAVNHWKADDANPFIAQCTVQRFEVTSRNNFHAYHYDDPASRASAERILEFVEQVCELFKSRYRADAVGLGHHVMQMPPYGMISSGNVSGFPSKGWKSFDDYPGYKMGLAHEIVHPFVRYGLKLDDPFFAMMIEGFPDYFYLAAMIEIRGLKWYREAMRSTEKSYLEKKKTGLSSRGRKLPEEKPIIQITADEVGKYKDVFILSDRASLFLNFLFEKMGQDKFNEFTRELFNGDVYDLPRFIDLVDKHLPGSKQDVDVWLATNDYPERFRIANLIDSMN
jgi:hypothetical protein